METRHVVWGPLIFGWFFVVLSRRKTPPFYMVTKGLCVGIFSGWKIMGTLTIKVSGSIQCKVSSVESGVILFEQALEGGKVDKLHALRYELVGNYKMVIVVI
ncbi:hypothetical protein HD554DRAFT_2042128 [Boletus coccyginus]|nr:hypothetical protein HD554DRAFT_2042128 [Boletus coccyginus]